MKKIILALIGILLTFNSCERDSLELDNTNFQKSKIAALSFETNEEMFQMARKIVLEKQNFDQIASKNFTKRSKFIRQFEPKTFNLTSEGLENLKQFHLDRLEYIYEIRNRYNFTSIQSIVDELYSLDVINPKKSESLFNQYKGLILKKEFGYETILDPIISNVINNKGLVKINNRIYKYEKDFIKIILDGNEDKIDLLQNLNQSSHDLHIEVTKSIPQSSTQYTRSSNNPFYQDCKEDIAPGNRHPFFVNTWHTGIIASSKVMFMQLGSFWLGTGTPILYPSTMTTSGIVVAETPNNSQCFSQEPRSTEFESETVTTTITTRFGITVLCNDAKVSRLEMEYSAVINDFLSNAAFIGKIFPI